MKLIKKIVAFIKKLFGIKPDAPVVRGGEPAKDSPKETQAE